MDYDKYFSDLQKQQEEQLEMARRLMEEQMQQEQLARRQKVLDTLKEWGIPYTMYEHPLYPPLRWHLNIGKTLIQPTARTFSSGTTRETSIIL